MLGILGKKIGMTQIFEDDGTAVPVTLVQAGPCVVVQRKTDETDGYEAVQLGLVEANVKNVNQPRLGHFSKAGVQPVRRLVELAVGVVRVANAAVAIPPVGVDDSERVRLLGRNTRQVRGNGPERPAHVFRKRPTSGRISAFASSRT